MRRYFQVLNDRFLRRLLFVTIIVIAGMAILHLRIRSAGRDAPRESVQSHSLQPEGPLPEGDAQDAVTNTTPSKGPFRVVDVLDGDTLVLDSGETVRLIGVDAPETHHPEIPVQRFGEEATDFVRRMAEGFDCTLECEANNLRDGYGRLLAYVYIDDRMVNAEIIRRGYGYAYTRFPFSYQEQFLRLEREARDKQYGLWHLSLRDGRIANLVSRYESLNLEGRKKLDEVLDSLMQKYGSEGQSASNSVAEEGNK